MRISPSIDVERLLAGGCNPGRNSQRIRYCRTRRQPCQHQEVGYKIRIAGCRNLQINASLAEIASTKTVARIN